MKRFVAYIYEYKNGRRIGNAGFIKTDLREDGCRMEAHVRLESHGDGTGKIFLIGDDPAPVQIPAGELILTHGQGHIRLTCPTDRLKKVDFLAVKLDDDRLLAAGFYKEPGEEITNCAVPEVPEPLKESEPPDDYRRILLCDIFNLSGKSRQLCRNCFLVHGFFNYHYLVIKTVKEEGLLRYYIGVPGVYELPEQKMAASYGFCDFELSATPPLGYWLRPLEEDCTAHDPAIFRPYRDTP